MSTPDYDVAVVGLGPVGGILANLLGKEGLEAVVFDRFDTAPELPRGVGMDAEMMRVVQTIGLADELEPLLKVFRGAQYLDAEGNVVSTRPGVSGTGPQGWPARYNVHQPDFENVMRAGLAAYPNLDLRTGYEVTDVGNDPEGGAVVVATELETGTAFEAHARYVVGCDGARSVVRKAAHVVLDDFGMNQPWIVMDFEINEKADLPDINTHFADPVTPAIYIHVVRNIRRFEFRAAPDEDLEKAVEPTNAWKRVSRWLRPDEAKLVRAAVYTHRSLVAENWRDGALIVAGDAAHQTPPFLGQGLCAGVRDVASLAWRLDAVVHRGAPDSLIDSYGAERSEHARFIIQTATQLGGELTNPDKSRIDALNKRVGREGQGQTPRLGPGLWEGGEVAGTLAPQPRLGDGRLLDDVTGYRFAVIAMPALLAELPAETTSLLARADIAVVAATGDATAWLDGLGARAVILRPDRYYYGAFADAVELDSEVRTIVAQIAPGALTGAGV